MFRFLFIIIVFCVGIFLWGIPRYTSLESTKYSTVKLGSTHIVLEIANTASDRYAGLSNRAKLCNDCGMIFVFSDSAQRNFVMREMLYPLDMIWVNNNKVIGVSENLQPEPAPYTVYNSPSAANMVIEVPAGYVQKNKITINHQLEYDN